MTQIEVTRKYCIDNNCFSIDDLLDLIQVQQIDEEETILSNSFSSIEDWFGVSNELGIIAYFGTENEALYYRLTYINRVLNK